MSRDRHQGNGLTVCVIGRNEGANLQALAQSLAPLRALAAEKRLRIETIYVDSASTDSSAAIARSSFDVVYELEESKNLCASAGRYVGTEKASGDWILYLDGDMTLRREFVSLIEEVLRADRRKEGWEGKVRHLYDNGTEDINSHGYAVGGMVIPQKVFYPIVWKTWLMI